MREHPDKDWLDKFDRDATDALTAACDHAKQYLEEITVVSDPHARVVCTRCGRVFEVTGEWDGP